MAVSATVFEILMLKARKLLIFSTPPLFAAPVRVNPLERRDEIWHQQTRIEGLPESGENMTLTFFVLIQYRLVTDRQTDGRTDTLLSQRPALA